MIRQLDDNEGVMSCDWCFKEMSKISLEEVKNNFDKYNVSHLCSPECVDSNSKFIEAYNDFKPYIDKYGLVQPSPGGGSGNGLLYTSEMIVGLNDFGLLRDEMRLSLFDTYRDCEIIPGLFRRDPNNTGNQEGPDDYVGIAAASPFIPGNFAKRILTYGQSRRTPIRGLLEELKFPNFLVTLLGWMKFRYNYNNINPNVMNKGSWLGRQPQLIAHFQFAAGETPWYWRKLWWCGAVLSSLFAKDHDSYILSYLLIRTAEKKSFLARMTAKIWRHYQNKRYPGGISQVIGEYFQNPSHPLVKWLTKS